MKRFSRFFPSNEESDKRVKSSINKEGFYWGESDRNEESDSDSDSSDEFLEFEKEIFSFEVNRKYDPNLFNVSFKGRSGDIEYKRGELPKPKTGCSFVADEVYPLKVYFLNKILKFIKINVNCPKKGENILVLGKGEETGSDFTPELIIENIFEKHFRGVFETNDRVLGFSRTSFEKLFGRNWCKVNWKGRMWVEYVPQRITGMFIANTSNFGKVHLEIPYIYGGSDQVIGKKRYRKKKRKNDDEEFEEDEELNQKRKRPKVKVDLKKKSERHGL